MATIDEARPRGWHLLKVALGSRKAGSMFAFGFSSGLPFALLIGTLNAWLGEAKVNLATIGVLSWIGLAYAFKFLWSPVVDRVVLPGLGRLGRRKSWILLCQGVLVAVLLGLAATDPAVAIGQFALLAVIGAVASATQDIAIDAWRIDIADDRTPVEVLSALYQLGARGSAIVGGAFALFLASRLSWPGVFTVMAGLMAGIALVALIAPDTQRPPVAAAHAALLARGEVDARTRAVALGVVGVCWLWSILTIGRFMAQMLTPLVPGATAPSAADFLKYRGPFIVAATVLVPLAVAAVLNRLRTRGQYVQPVAEPPGIGLRAAADHLYMALVAPVAELVGRLGWGVLAVIGLILTYALCYNIWASFAYPFYLDFMHYSKDEVAFASKIFGILMTMLGVGLGGFLFLRVGRFPTVMLGVIMPIFGNFLYADLADGAAKIDAVLRATRLDAVALAAGSDLRMARLLLTICYENISTGIAGAAFVAYVSTIVSKRFSAVQYASLSSLVFLVGSLLKGAAGQAFDLYGYAPVFRWVALLGLVAIAFVALEWWRASRAPAWTEPGDTGAPA
ncbi:MFS transporter [Sphingomonas bacterium]|uniref:MFS transporter n=1 Tax=Sphingomonas bacterium TaxID=1895847 RepID=UPI0020C6AF35|nr:MFS transporter [Sphingomonas bacterium]